MSIKLALSVYGIDNKYLSFSEKHVLVRLALFGQDDGTNIYPSHSRIAQDTGLSRRAVINILDNLEQKNFCLQTKKTGKVNSYQLCIETINSCKNSLDKRSSESGSLVHLIHTSSEPDSHLLVNQMHTSSERGSHKSKDKENKKVNTHSKGDFARSVEGVCDSSLSSQNEFQAREKEFQALWDLWTKKEGFEAAKRIYDQIISREISSENILKAATKKIESIHSKYVNENDRTRYCPQLNNWLEKKGYLDEPHVSKNGSSTELTPKEMKKRESMNRGEERLRNLTEKNND